MRNGDYMKELYSKLEEEFKKVEIEITNIQELNPDIWNKVLLCLKRMLKEYPELPIGLLKRINVINPKYKFLCATSFRYDDKTDSYDISSGIDLDLCYYRFSDTKNMRIKLETTNIDILLDDTIEFAIAHAFGMILEINLGIMAGLIHKDKESKSVYEDYLYNSKYSKMIIENVFKKLDINKNAESIIKKEVSETAAASYHSLFSEAIAFHYFNKDNEITKEIIKEYKTLKNVIEEGC